jgi:hypothetical protein
VPMQQLRDLLLDIPGSHVMLQTLRNVPLSHNSLERDPRLGEDGYSPSPM